MRQVTLQPCSRACAPSRSFHTFHWHSVLPAASYQVMFAQGCALAKALLCHGEVAYRCRDNARFDFTVHLLLCFGTLPRLLGSWETTLLFCGVCEVLTLRKVVDWSVLLGNNQSDKNSMQFINDMCDMRASTFYEWRRKGRGDSGVCCISWSELFFLCRVYSMRYGTEFQMS